MRELRLIRELYYPFHPVAKLKTDIVYYAEFAPHISLQPYIFHYWEMKTRGRLEKKFDHRVVPNGCIDIYFESGSPHQAFVTGVSNRHSSVSLSREFHYIGICFVPTVAPQLFKLNGSDLQNHHELLENVAPSLANYIGSVFTPGLSQENIKALLDKHFIREISRLNVKCDSRVLHALHNIFVTNGRLRVESDLDVGMSIRQLRRVFDTYIGDSPKSFARTVRFQKCLQATVLDPTTAKVFYDFGYYDQVHYIKDFKKLYGLTPTEVDTCP